MSGFEDPATANGPNVPLVSCSNFYPTTDPSAEMTGLIGRMVNILRLI